MEAGDAATLAAANTHTDQQVNQVRQEMADGDAATLAAANQHADQAVAEAEERAMDYTDESVQQSERRTLTTIERRSAEAEARAMDYADAVRSASFDYTDQLRADLNDRFERIDRSFADLNTRLDRQGAMAAASAQMAATMASSGKDNRWGLGVGNQNGKMAFALGIQKKVSDNTTVTFGVSTSGKDTQVGVGLGGGW